MDLSLHLDLTSFWIGFGAGMIALILIAGIAGAVSEKKKTRQKEAWLKDFENWSLPLEKVGKPKPKKPKPNKSE